MNQSHILGVVPGRVLMAPRNMGAINTDAAGAALLTASVDTGPAAPFVAAAGAITTLVGRVFSSRKTFFDPRNSATEQLAKLGRDQLGLNYQQMIDYYWKRSTKVYPREKKFIDDWWACLNHDHIGDDAASAKYLKPSTYRSAVDRLTKISIPCFLEKYTPQDPVKVAPAQTGTQLQPGGNVQMFQTMPAPAPNTGIPKAQASVPEMLPGVSNNQLAMYGVGALALTALAVYAKKSGHLKGFADTLPLWAKLAIGAGALTLGVSAYKNYKKGNVAKASLEVGESEDAGDVTENITMPSGGGSSSDPFSVSIVPGTPVANTPEAAANTPEAQAAPAPKLVDSTVQVLPSTGGGSQKLDLPTEVVKQIQTETLVKPVVLKNPDTVAVVVAPVAQVPKITELPPSVQKEITGKPNPFEQAKAALNPNPLPAVTQQQQTMPQPYKEEYIPVVTVKPSSPVYEAPTPPKVVAQVVSPVVINTSSGPVTKLVTTAIIKSDGKVFES